MGRWGRSTRPWDLLRSWEVEGVKANLSPWVENHLSLAPLQPPDSRNFPAQGQWWALGSHLSLLPFFSKSPSGFHSSLVLLSEKSHQSTVWFQQWVGKSLLKSQGTSETPTGVSWEDEIHEPLWQHPAQTHIRAPPHSLCSSLRHHHKIPDGQIWNFYRSLEKSPFFLDISKKFLLPVDWLFISPFV